LKIERLLGITPDNLTTLYIEQRVGQNEDTATYFDDLTICYGNLTDVEVECVFPVVFCDDFNYETSLAFTNDWVVLNQDNSRNNIFSPTNDELIWNNKLSTEPQAIGYYEIERFDVFYPTREGATVTASVEAPAFSVEFEINVTQINTSDILINTFDYNGEDCVQLILEENGSYAFSVYYLNESEQQTYITNVSVNTTHDFKFSVYFGDSNKSYPFNSTFSVNNFDLIIDGNTFRGLNFDDDCKNLNSVFFVRETDSMILEIDNYYHYVGTDKTIDTTAAFSNPLYVNETTAIDETTTETGDFGEAVDNIWGTFGLNTTRSKTMFGLALMLILGIFMMGIFVKTNTDVNVGVVLFIEFIFMIFLTFLGLLPIWIVIVVTILGAGVGALVIKQQSS